MTNEVIQNILTRCSVRAYDDRPVEREKIDTLLQCAVHAPSAMNRQTWHFSAVLNREKIAKLAAAVGLSLIHTPSPRDAHESRMPSSA